MNLLRLILIFNLGAWVNTSVCLAVQTTSQAEANSAENAPAILPTPAPAQLVKFDELAVQWEADNAKMIRGFKLAEAFRLMLLDTTDGVLTKAKKIGDVLEAFRIQNIALDGRPNLSGFKITSKDFVAQVMGQQTLDASIAFSDFNGRWYGIWDGQPVDHNWHTTRPGNSLTKDLATKFPNLKAYQYAWIGDGFGWNYLAKPEQSAGQVVLGFVHHLQPFQPKQIRSDFPLVGFKDEGNRLIWVTPSHIFFEEVFTDSTKNISKDGTPLYAITGFDYSWKDGEIIPAAEGFQAIYSRNPDQRPKFLKFEVAIDLKR